jgi:hypothetical protein
MRKTNVLIYNVLHGDILDKLEYWYNIVKGFEFDGWSYSVNPKNSPLMNITSLMFLYSKGHRKNLHSLGVASTRTIPALAYASKYIDNLTYDSSTFVMGSRFRAYYLPYLLDRNLSARFGKIYNGKMKELPCDCPVCKLCSIEDMNSQYGGSMITAHNLYMSIKFNNFIDAIKNDDEIFKGFIDRYSDEETKYAIDFINTTINEGFNKAYNKYKPYVDIYKRKQVRLEQMDMFEGGENV